MSWTEQQLAEVLRSNPGLRVELPVRDRAVDPVAEAPGDWLQELMACPAFRGRLSPEEEVSHWCAAELRKLSRARRLRCIWTCVPGENKQAGRLGVLHQARTIALGYVPGCSDFLFIWDTGGGGIELKIEEPQSSLLAPGGKPGLRKGRRTYQRPRQRDFEKWCEEQGVRYALVRRWAEMKAVLKDWGRISD